ncbi:hypothetical protein [Streptomyces sp. NPDC012510]|uniref:hypothetical protein n=1 Tax=Streptomyces sp. NPDC012510 TaxID=3364838 RepID=UPI0036E64DA7
MTDPMPLTPLTPPRALLPADDRHLPSSWITDYAHGALSPDLLTHTEAHLLTCLRCSGSVNSAVLSGTHGARLDAVRGALFNRLGGPPPGDPPPPARQGGGRPWRRPPWLAAVHGLRLPWLLAVLGVCAAGVALARFDGSADTLPVLLLLAPLLPLLCVAASYGGKADPFAEVTRTTPAGGLRLLLIRTGQVLALCVPLLAAAAFALSARAPVHPRARLEVGPAGWLLPCLFLTLTTLLLSSYVDSRLSALLTTSGWLLVVAAVARLHTQKHPVTGLRLKELITALNQLLGESAQTVWAIGAAVLVELLFLRRHAFGTPTPGDRRAPRGPR